MNLRFLVSGGPGAGKTTLLNALALRGYVVVPESARRIIQKRVQAGLSPRPSETQFAKDILEWDVAQYQKTRADTVPVFFDRGITDALCMAESIGSITADEKSRIVAQCPYNSHVFIAPPWKTIYRNDAERDQTFETSVNVYRELENWYIKNGFSILELPKSTLETRIAFVEEKLDWLQSELNQC